MPATNHEQPLFPCPAIIQYWLFTNDVFIEECARAARTTIDGPDKAYDVMYHTVLTAIARHMATVNHLIQLGTDLPEADNPHRLHLQITHQHYQAPTQQRKHAQPQPWLTQLLQNMRHAYSCTLFTRPHVIDGNAYTSPILRIDWKKYGLQ
mgnify:CR=1 FL=1